MNEHDERQADFYRRIRPQQSSDLDLWARDVYEYALSDAESFQDFINAVFVRNG